MKVNDNVMAAKKFEIAIKNEKLPRNMEGLLALYQIGGAALKYYQGKLKAIDKSGATKKQWEATLKAGQQAGEFLLDIESKIGELTYTESRPKSTIKKNGYGKIDNVSDLVIKHKRLGFKEKQMKQARIIYKFSKVVKNIKQQARKNDDIATKTAVFTEIKQLQVREHKKQLQEEYAKIKAQYTPEHVDYINALQQCLKIIPYQPPTGWTIEGRVEAMEYAQKIIRRLKKVMLNQMDLN